ncbi:Lrp/AsnC family transcriptional regulator [Nanoarchaeota archaeon]
MKSYDPESPILTKNDQEVLKKILDAAKMPDSEIARQLRLSQQAISKIREKLEGKGIIQGYMPIIDFKKLGIHVIVMLEVKVQSPVWKQLTELQVAQRIREIPQVITAFRVPESDITHVLVLGFRNMDKKDQFLMKLQTKYRDEIEIKSAYPISVNRIITMSPVGLLREVLDKKEPVLDHLFLQQN